MDRSTSPQASVLLRPSRALRDDEARLRSRGKKRLPSDRRFENHPLGGRHPGVGRGGIAVEGQHASDKVLREQRGHGFFELLAALPDPKDAWATVAGGLIGVGLYLAFKPDDDTILAVGPGFVAYQTRF